MKYPLFFYARKSLQKNRKITAATIFCMLLFVVCASMAGLLTHSYTVFQETAYRSSYGDYDGVLKNVTPDQEAQLRTDPQVSWVGFADTYGCQPIADIVDDDFLVVGTMEESAREQAALRLLEGSWPQTEGELVLERSAASKLRLDHPVGSTVTLLLSPFAGDGEVRREYRVVGVCSDYAQVQGDYGLELSASVRLPNALTFGALDGMAPLRHALVKAQPGAPVLSALTPYIQQGGNAYYVHPTMRSADTASSGDGYLSALLTVLLASVFLLGIFSVAANLAITFQRKKEQLHLLKLSGTENGQLLRFLLYQDLTCGAIALLLGIPSALLLSRLASDTIIRRYLPEFSLSLSVPLLAWLALLLLVLIILGGTLPFFSFLARRPMESQKEGKKEQKKQAAGKPHPARERYPLLLWGMKSALFHSEKAVAAILSFSLFTAALLGGILISTAAEESFTQQVFCDYAITQYDGNFVSQLEIPLKPGYGILQQDADELAAQPGVARCTTIKSLRANILMDPAVTPREFIKQYPIENLEIHVSDPREFGQEKERFGYKKTDQFFPSTLHGVTEDFLRSIASSVTEGTLEPGNPDAITLVTTDSSVPYKIGDSITFTQQIRLHPEDVKNMETRRFDFTGRVAAIVRLTQTNNPLYKMAQYRSFLPLVNEGLFAREQLAVENRTIWLELSNGGESDEVKATLTRLRERYPGCEVLSQQQEAAQQRTAVVSVRTICAAICAVIGCFGAFSLCNTVAQLILDQKQTRGILRAIGLERRQAILGQFLEIAAWIFLSWLFGLLLALLLSFGLEGMALRISPWAAVAALAAQLLLGLTSAALSIRRLYRGNVSGLLSRVE